VVQIRKLVQKILYSKDEVMQLPASSQICCVHSSHDTAGQKSKKQEHAQLQRKETETGWGESRGTKEDTGKNASLLTLQDTVQNSIQLFKVSN
jgi:hypothetical protein